VHDSLPTPAIVLDRHQRINISPETEVCAVNLDGGVPDLASIVAQLYSFRTTLSRFEAPRFDNARRQDSSCRWRPALPAPGRRYDVVVNVL
jgi:hypothetical protein